MKKKMVLNKETLKTLTLSEQDLSQVVGGTIIAWPTNVNTGASCHSCAPSCLACPGTGGTIYINPNPVGR